MVGRLVSSVGLGGSDVGVRVPDHSWVDDGKALIQQVVDYVEGSGVRLKAGETFGYGFWIVRFEKEGRRRFTLAELSPDATGFVPGADLALRYWRDQHDVCGRSGATFAPPRPDLMVVVSDGVYEGDAVQGVRYPAPSHMTGWYLTTGRFDGDVSSMRVEHLHHVTAGRPDLARYVALPSGYRFDTTSGVDDVWFDAAVAAESPD